MLNNNQSLSVSDYKRFIKDVNFPKLEDIIFLQEVGSTNDYLLTLDAPQKNKAIICMAEQQTSGRGTKGRVWHSQFGASLIYSIAWRLPKNTKDLSALTLAVGVVVINALEQHAYYGVQLKWPNDLLVGGAKLGGILVEVKQGSDYLHLVCGIGVNVLSSLDESLIDQAFIALDSVSPDQICSRNELAANLTNGLLELFSGYPDTGFKPWQDVWNAKHAFRDQLLDVKQFDKTFSGIAKGVNESGVLLVQTEQGLQELISAEISHRPNFQTS